MELPQAGRWLTLSRTFVGRGGDSAAGRIPSISNHLARVFLLQGPVPHGRFLQEEEPTSEHLVLENTKQRGKARTRLLFQVCSKTTSRSQNHREAGSGEGRGRGPQAAVAFAPSWLL